MDSVWTSLAPTSVTAQMTLSSTLLEWAVWVSAFHRSSWCSFTLLELSLIAKTVITRFECFITQYFVISPTLCTFIIFIWMEADRLYPLSLPPSLPHSLSLPLSFSLSLSVSLSLSLSLSLWQTLVWGTVSGRRVLAGAAVCRVAWRWGWASAAPPAAARWAEPGGTPVNSAPPSTPVRVLNITNALNTLMLNTAV